ncbi:hypothetical protein [Anianabacter salinae]|uniref:hypothetical protein n=1 Tax=Anianabacter salinae TaxID=2851023 RepID=UPI00225E04C1|nr:hypothetical protein [Anianabacter salinae]MBV0913088.1 hypothetical protein [Anianabacter salinae]
MGGGALMQGGRIILGCIAAWVTGSLAMTISALATGAGNGTVLGVVVTFLTWLYFGLLPAIPLTVLAFVLWVVLARYGATVRWWYAPASTFCIGVVLFSDSFDERLSLLWLLIAALFVGAAFWLGAFGMHRHVRLALPGQPPR